MTTTKDTHARRLAVVALVAALGAFMLGSARADSTTEPDAAALEVRVAALEQATDEQATQIASLASDIVTLHDTLGEVVDATNENSDAAASIGCLAYSDYHYFKERVGAKPGAKHGKKWRLPIMVWNMSDPACRPSKAEWRPKGRRVLPLMVASR